jgi:arylsulfatase A-like enzyme
VIANLVYRPEIDSKKSVDVSTAAVVARGDEISRGNYVAVPTIAELVRGAGRQAVTATAKTIGLLQDRNLDSTNKNSVALFSGQMRSSEAFAPVAALLGPFPKLFAQKDIWTTKALTEIFWKNGIPAFTFLWLSEPDGSQHNFAPGSAQALAAIKSADENLGNVLAALDRHGARAFTDIFVVSDHGFSTIERSIDLREVLNAAGFSATTSEPKPGDIMLAGNGGTVLFYVIEYDAPVVQRLVEFLQQSDFAGVIFTRKPTPGTFGLDQAKIDAAHGPDVALSFRWNEKKNQFGISGMIDADWNRRAGQGTHATLSPFDMHNMLIAAGPDFRRGQVSDLPSGNVDLAPTILRILGIKPTQQLDGRVLFEAMVKSDGAPPPKSNTETVDAKREFASGTWRQTLKTTRVGSTIYLDEGNGRFAPNGDKGGG